MYLFALEKGITLTDQELAACKEAAEAYYASLSDAEKEYIGADVEVIEAAYVHYTYANDLYNTMTEGGVFEISDDAARVMDAYVIRTSEESNAKMAYADLQDGEEFLAVASIYAEQSTITTSISRSSYNDTLVSAAFALEEGAYTEVLAGEDGYYIIYCVSKYNEDLTEENRALLVRLAQEEAFDESYEEFAAGLYWEFNSELWDSLVPPVSGEITTTDFFKIYNQYI